jgi:hypothetical protein
MNERIQKLAEQAGWGQGKTYYDCMRCSPFDPEKFAELIVAEAFRSGMLYSAKKYKAVSDEQFTGNDVAMFLEMEACELSDEDIKQHFGVEESSSQAEQEAAEFIATEDKKVASRYGYFPKLHPSEWKD